MRFPLDLRAPKRKRAAESWARAHHLPVPNGFGAASPYVGGPARQLAREIERAAHLPITGEFDGPLLRLLFPPPSTAQHRADVAAIGEWGYRHAAQIGYTQDAPDRDEGLHLAPLTLPLDPLDCGKWLQLCYFWARVPKTHDPMGTGYRDGGNTENILATCRPLPSIRALGLADPIVWGRKGETHHAAFVIADAGTDDPLLSSHGRAACPCNVRFSVEHRAQGGRVANPLTILG